MMVGFNLQKKSLFWTTYLTIIIPSLSCPFYTLHMCVIYVYIQYIFNLLFQKFFCTDTVAKFRHADRISILQCFGCQTPMKCIQCQGVPYGPMQGSILLPCSNVMFLHNKCPTRPPYPCIRLHRLYSFQHSLMLPSVHCCTADCLLMSVFW